jgi:O-antigen/teichoic acid export membrane protein
MARIVDSGTGVNSQIIGTSVFWRFELISGMILLSLIAPLTYFLIKEYGIMGAGYSNLISLTIYNIIRLAFLKRKFGMNPFSKKTIYAIIVSFVSYGICYYVFQSFHGFSGILVKTIVFIALYGGAIVYFDLTPDLNPVLKTIREKSKFRK